MFCFYREGFREKFSFRRSGFSVEFVGRVGFGGVFVD